MDTTKVMIPNLENDNQPDSYKTFNVLRALAWMLLWSCFSQMVMAQELAPFGKNSLSVEGLGAGAYYSINYSRVFLHKEAITLGAKTGWSSYHIKDFKDKFNPDMIIPLGLQLTYGQQHQIVAGIGNTFVGLIKASAPAFDPKRAWTNNGYILLGYRFRKKGSRWFFGGAYSPLLEKYERYRHWGTLEVGCFL